jgi:hypothetical protein
VRSTALRTGLATGVPLSEVLVNGPVAYRVTAYHDVVAMLANLDAQARGRFGTLPRCAVRLRGRYRVRGAEIVRPNTGDVKTCTRMQTVAVKEVTMQEVALLESLTAGNLFV